MALADFVILRLSLLLRYAHLLEGGRILLGLVNPQGNIEVYVESLSQIDASIQRRTFARFFDRYKIGETCLFSVDESRRMLAVYSPARVCPLLRPFSAFM